MKTNQFKIFFTALFVLPLLGFAVVKTSAVRAVHALDDDPVAVYKTKCAMCHKPDASKFFDPAKTDEELVEIVLNGKKGEKPPYMPGFSAKGMTEEQATALVEHMKTLQPADDTDTNANTSY
ncbi:MAG: cytochrome c [Acidobacteriota bacterium]|nr:cytochrome c [Acidobacteriota bacterium]MDH3530076.1 cytochrome c [Acidobacteriota bacterium]